MPLTEDDLRGLSAVERETLLSMQDEDEDDDIGQELGVTARDALAAELDDGAADEPVAVPAAKTTEPAEPVESDSTAEPATTDNADPAGLNDEPAPLGQHRETPDDVAEQRLALRGEESAAHTQLMDGEITQEAYQEVRNRTQDKLDDLLRAEASDQARRSMERDAMYAQYDSDLKAIVTGAKAAGLNYADPKMAPEFDRLIRMFCKEAEEQGLVDQPGRLAVSQYALKHANDLMMHRHIKVAPTPVVDPKKHTGPRPPADRSVIKTLANLPVASDASIGSEFADLEGLEGSALEKRLARLTPDQQERYLGA